jgi:hypothetical protein
MASWCRSRSSCRGGAVIEPTTNWQSALAFLAGYGVAELQHRIRKHLRSMGPPRDSYGPRLPEQPIAADLIRYANWKQEQVERALRNEPSTKPQFPPPRLIREDFLP